MKTNFHLVLRTRKFGYARGGGDERKEDYEYFSLYFFPSNKKI